jgi:hypothetical protein
VAYRCGLMHGKTLRERYETGNLNLKSVFSPVNTGIKYPRLNVIPAKEVTLQTRKT